ncbi:hypothetical protein M885DRAFT_150779 [Pelagophyceae sp. CCMP2097]|nr:hypothetical protein M885DRAFT_150779 [Pelagophyceae sp. CCMP2097]
MSGRRFPREDGGAAAGVASPRAEASRRPPAPSPRPRRDDGNAGPRAPAPVSVDAGSPRGPEAASAENPPISNGAATSPRSPSPRSLADRRDSAVPRTPQGTRGSPHAGGLATQRYRGDSCDSERSVLTQPFQGGSPRPSPPRPPPPPPASPPPPSPQRAPKTDLKTPTHPPNPPTQSASLTDAQRLRIEASKQRALEVRPLLALLARAKCGTTRLFRCAPRGRWR